MKLLPIETNYIPEIINMEGDTGTSEFIIPYNKEKHYREIQNPHNRYLGIFSGDTLIGFFILGIEEGGKRIEFRRIVISEKDRGYGQTAIKELENYCRVNWQTEKIWLDVFENNERGIHIYNKLGYIKKGRTELEGKQLIIMEKNLSHE